MTRIRNIGSTAQANGIFVTVGAGGKLGFQVSSRRYKDDIKPMNKASEALFALKPVSFRYKEVSAQLEVNKTAGQIALNNQ